MWLRLTVLVLFSACASTGAGDDQPVVDASPGTDVALDPDAPVDGTVTEGCVADVQCESSACNESTGTCIDEARVLFVAATGGDTGTCTRTAPCASVARAVGLLAADRDTIALAAGNYAGIFMITKPVLLSGPSRDPTAVFLTSPTNNAIIAFLRSAKITIEGVSIGGNTAMNAPQAVTIGDNADITLDRVLVRDNDGTGVYCNGSKLTVIRYEAYASDYGILANETCIVDVDRSYVHDGGFAGLAAAGQYRVVNTILAKNSIGFIPFGGNSGTLDFITFASQTSTVISSTHPITATNSIFANNTTAPSAPVAISYSLFTGAAPAGTGNLTGDPMFVNAAAGDYHLGAGSPAIDRANPAATLATDFDGNPRPSGAARDIGADER